MRLITTRLLMAMRAAYGAYIAPPAFVVSVSAASAAEGANLVHTVTLSGPVVGAPIAYAFVLTAGTATAGVDYGSPSFNNGVTLAAGYATVPIGFSSFQVTIPALTDALDSESTETYTLNVGGISAGGSILNVISLGTLAYGANADAGEVDTPWTAPAWSSSVSYKPSDMVNNGGSKFWAIKAVPAATATSDTAYWQPVATVYYMDADNGLDSYNGLSQYPGYVTNADGTQGNANAAYGPWQTLTKLREKTSVGYWDTAAANSNTRPLNHAPWTAGAPGDMFLFKRGTTATYVGQIQVSAYTAAITHGKFLFGAYGAGARPIIEHSYLSAQFATDLGVFWINRDETKIRNLVLDGLYGVSDPGNVLHPKKNGITIGGKNVAFVNGFLRNVGGDGVSLTATYADSFYGYNSTVTYCGLESHPGNGVAGDSPGALLERMTVSYCGKTDTFLQHGVYFANWDNTTVRYCDIHHNGTFGINSGAYGANPTIEYNLIHDNLNGIDMGTSNVTLQEYYTGTMWINGNIIYNNGVARATQGFGIYTINSCPLAYITNNLIYGNYGDGITVDQTSYAGAGAALTVTKNINIWNNTIILSANAGVVGIRFAGNNITVCTVKNNIVYSASTTAFGIKTDTSMALSELTLQSNRYHLPNKSNPLEVATILGAATTLASLQGSGYESGSTTGDPLFVGTGDNPYSLQAGSPLISAGQALALAQDVIQRARASSHTIGAYE